jgi:hypothetical protein
MTVLCVIEQTTIEWRDIFQRFFPKEPKSTIGGTQMKRSILLSAAMVIATSAFAEKEEKIRWSQLPAAVQKTMTDNAGGGKIEEIEKETKMKDGKTVTVYEAEVKKPGGRKIEIKVGEDGRLIELKDD